MGIIVQNDWRNRAIFIAVITTLGALFLSRLFLSISSILFLIVTLAHGQAWQHVKSFFRSPFLLSMSMLFFIPFISGLWSSDISEWLMVLRVKLPLLLLPIAFAGNWQLEEKQWRKVNYCLLLLVTLGCCWSLWQYFRDMNAINESYLKAKTIPTPLKDDHVRFSWLVSIAILGGMLLLMIVEEKKRKLLLSLLLLFMVAYLHVLSARTGIVLLYFFLLCYVLFLAIRRKGRTLVLVALVVIVCILGWLSFPTLQNRIRYNRYDQSYIRNETYLPGASDGNRMLSLRAAWHTLQQNPFGVGAGDVRKATNEWYASHVPVMLESDKLYPSSEWMVYANMTGWPGFFLFTAIMIFPLCMKKMRHRFYWMMLNSMAAIGFLADTSLEVQYGVYIYSFFVLCWWKWFNSQKEITLKHD